jgi:hypothetical protein
MGDVRLEILETPGHTPEGISILVYYYNANWSWCFWVMQSKLGLLEEEFQAWMPIRFVL